MIRTAERSAVSTMDGQQARGGGKLRTLGVLLAVVVLFYAAIIAHHWMFPAR